MDKTDLKSIASLSDEDLLVRLSRVLHDSRRVESELVAHIAEVDARRLYAREASPSMHKYCTDRLHLSDAEAYFRITAARASRRHPILLTMLEDGRLHLSGIEAIAPHLDGLSVFERDALLARASYKSKRELKELVAEIAPKPDVPPHIRKVPEPRRTNDQQPRQQERAEAATASQATLSRQSSPPRPTLPAQETRDQRQRVEPLAPARYKVQFTASAEFREKLERLTALMPGHDLAAVIDAAVSEKLERFEAKRFGKVKKPRKTVEDVDTAPGARSISAPVRRFVWERDGGQCTFESADGRRCPEWHRLELHHDDPFGRGGDGSAANIRLLCRTHNLLMAEKDYGKDVIDCYRRSADRVREPSPDFELGPDGAVIKTARADRRMSAVF